MKIAYLSHGHSVYDLRFLAKMVERGHQPHLISYWPDESKVDIPGVTSHYYYLPFPRFKMLQVIMHLRKLLKSIQPNVLHTTFVQHHGFYGALSGFHPTLSMPWGSDILVVPDESLYGRWVTRFTLKRADMITCDCELVKKKIMDLVGYPAEKIVVFPWGVDLSIFKPAAKPSALRERLGWSDKKVLIMNRVFKQVYGIDVFIESLPLLFRIIPSVRVILAGAGPMEQNYRQRIIELGLNHLVYFAGWLTETAVAEHLNAADVYVTSSWSDGTSASLLEAMACGLPVVVSDAPVYFEWVKDGENGYIVRRGDSKMLAERLADLLDDDLLCRNMGICNLEIAHERANWKRNFDTLQGIYETLVKRMGGSTR